MQQRSQRATLTYYPTVRNLVDGNTLGFLIDLSPTGMKVMSEKPIEIEKYYRLGIEVQSENAAPRELAVEAKAMWSGRDINPDFIDTGFAFRNLTTASGKIIVRLMNEYQFSGQSL